MDPGLNEEDMPVFAHTARSIAAASSEDDIPTAQLAQYILRDSSMTARILRLANSVYYNPGGQAINTISRVILFLGFNVVRSMAITIAILEPLLKGCPVRTGPGGNGTFLPCRCPGQGHLPRPMSRRCCNTTPTKPPRLPSIMAPKPPRVTFPCHNSMQPTSSPMTSPNSGHKPDFTLQMNILHELTTMLHEKIDINAVLGTIMEGSYRALGMERTVVAFVTGNDEILHAKYVLGDEKDKLERCFRFPVAAGQKNLFAHILTAKEACWVNVRNLMEYEALLSPDIKQCLGVTEFLVMPIWIGNKGKGLIYADGKLSGRRLTAEEFQTFTHFSEYASIAIELHYKK